MTEILPALVGTILGFVFGQWSHNIQTRRRHSEAHQDAAWRLFVALERVGSADYDIAMEESSSEGEVGKETHQAAAEAHSALDEALSLYMRTTPSGNPSRAHFRIVMMCEFATRPWRYQKFRGRSPVEVTYVVAEELAKLHPWLEEFIKIRPELQREANTFLSHELTP